MSNEYKDMLYDDMYNNAFEYSYFKDLNQRWKWTDERYINHPINVQQIMCEHMNTTYTYGWFDRLEEANIFSVLGTDSGACLTGTYRIQRAF